MPTETLVATSHAGLSRHRCLPEVVLAALAGAVFLGCLGSVDLWGKREQRASAEAIDTIDHDHWLVAQIQGRPRLEKPPLPRWTIAGLMMLTGRRDELIVRLPGAISALLTVALVYALGRRIGGRAVGLASALVLSSLGFFVGEMRQASNDGPLVLFTTLALYACWRRLHGEDDDPRVDTHKTPLAGVFRLSDATKWQLVLHAALGLGFLTKGPVILLLVSVAIVPYLAFARRLGWGLRRLAGGYGFLLFAGLALCWPLAVLANDPSALRVWSLEISEKTGFSHILEHRHHTPLLGEWPAMVLPWTLIALVAVMLPPYLSMTNAGRTGSGVPMGGPRRWSFVWFAWWWGVGNLLVFSVWSVAKPNYYVPCVPGMALLIGTAWVYLARAARGRGRAAVAARGILQAQWVLVFVAATVSPLVVRGWMPDQLWPYAVAIAWSLVAAVVVSIYIWRRGGDALCLAPITAACAFGILIAYGLIAPVENDAHSHRALAQRLRTVLPPGARQIMFFNEIDEGLWFYGDGLVLTPVPGSHPRYNTAYDLAHSYLTERLPRETLADLEAKRQAHEKHTLVDWLDHNGERRSYLLIRSHLFDLMSADLAGRVTPLFRETGLKRNELILLEVAGNRPAVETAVGDLPTRR